MTNRISTLTVALDENYREDDVQFLVDAIKMLRGVTAVEKNVADSSEWLAQTRVRAELQQKLWEVLYPKK